MSGCCNRSIPQPRPGGIGQIEWVLRKFGLLPALAGGNAMLAQDRILYVAQTQPQGADPTKFFTSINDAIVEATTNLNPTGTNPVLVLIAPGDYVEAVTMQPWVHLAAWGGTAEVQNGAIGYDLPRLLGPMTFAPTGGTEEQSGSLGLEVDGAITYDATGKTGGLSLFAFTGLQPTLADPITFTGRPAGGDIALIRGTVSGLITATNVLMDAEESFLRNGLVLSDVTGSVHTLRNTRTGSLSLSGVLPTIYSSELRCTGPVSVAGSVRWISEHSRFETGAVDVAGSSVVTLDHSSFDIGAPITVRENATLEGRYCDCLGTVGLSDGAVAQMQHATLRAGLTVSNTSVLNASNATAFGPLTINDTATVSAPNSTWQPGTTITNNSATVMDARGAVIPSNVTLAGAGPILRSLSFTTAITAGVTIVPIPNNPLGSSAYHVTATPVTPVTPGPVPIIAAKGPATLTLDDGGTPRQFDILIVPDQP